MNKREYIQANKDWLEAKAKEEGVKALPKEIYYKVLAVGNAQSATPSVRSIVTAHYTGKTIDVKTLSLGAVPMNDWTIYRLDATALDRLSK
jgi:FKBP-type peptidyl-prolyl cis-trans isomerase